MNQIWRPAIEVESSHGTREVVLDSHHLTNRYLFLNGEITDETADRFVSQFLYLQEEKKPVNIYLNTPGGSVTAGLVIYDLIQSANLPINIICTGCAYSMGALLLAGGQKGRRFILPHSKVMIHEPLLTGGVGGSATSIHNISQSIMETKRIVNDILSNHTGKSRQEIDKATASDYYMNAQESIDFGICDTITNTLVIS